MSAAAVLRRFDDLPLGTRFRYIGFSDVHVKLDGCDCGLVACWDGPQSDAITQQVFSFANTAREARTLEVEVVESTAQPSEVAAELEIACDRMARWALLIDDTEHQAQTITSLCDRIERIFNIAIDQSLTHEERVKHVQEWSAGFMQPPGSKPAPDVLASVKERRDKYEALIGKGKGEWPKPGYVRDEIWAGWQHTRMVLDSIINAAGTERTS